VLHAEEIGRHNHKNKSFPRLESLLLLSRGGDAYKWMCSNYMKCVVGAKQWSHRYHRNLLSEVATESDESFLVLTMENNYDRWLAEYNLDENDGEGRKMLPDARYTNSGTSKHSGRGSSRRFHGWSREGYKRFNALHALIKEDRAQRSAFEMELKQEFESSYMSSKQDVEEYEEDEDDEELFPANDMEGVEQAPTMGEDSGGVARRHLSDNEEDSH
jgi:hypothetical protein